MSQTVSAAETLREAIAAVLGEPVRSLVRLSGGASRETWAVDAEGAYILQRRGPSGSDAADQRSDTDDAESSGGRITTSGATEAALLRAAHAAGVPVPTVVASGSGRSDGFGTAWMLTERVPGESLPKTLLRDDAYTSVRTTMARRCGEAIGAIHAIDPAAFADDLRNADQIASLRSVLDAVPTDYPVFELALRWLELNPAPARPTVVVHGDFRTGNLLVQPDDAEDPGLSAVLDWELSHLGNPVEDLGWFCVRAWRFGSPHAAGGFGPVEELLDGYEAATGERIDVAELRWWELLGTVKWGVICAMQAGYHLSGAARSVELAAIGRRTAENEHDVLALLEELM